MKYFFETIMLCCHQIKINLHQIQFFMYMLITIKFAILCERLDEFISRSGWRNVFLGNAFMKQMEEMEKGEAW